MTDFFQKHRPDNGEIHELEDTQKVIDAIKKELGTDKFILVFMKKEDLPCGNPNCVGSHAATLLNNVTLLDIFTSGQSLVEHAIKQGRSNEKRV